MSTDEHTNEHTTAIKKMLFEDKIQDLMELPYIITKMFQVQYPYTIIDKFVTDVQEYAITNILSIFDIETIDESDEETIEVIQSLVRDILTTAYLINTLLAYAYKQEAKNLSSFQHDIPNARLNDDSLLSN